MYTGIFIGQPVANLASETHTTANYIHMAISVRLCCHYYLEQDS